MLRPANPKSARGLLFAVVFLVSACSSGSIDVVASKPTLPTSSAADESSNSPPGSGDTTSSDQSSTPGSDTTGPVAADVTGVVPETTVPTTSITTLAQEPLPADCAGIDSPLLPVQLTYVDEGKLIALGLNSEPVCLVDLGPDAGVGLVEWGAQGDRVMFTNGRVEILAEHGRPGGVAGPDSLAFSWPTGFNMVWLRDGVVQKSTADDRQQRDLVIGAPVSELIYHPEGQFLLVVVDDGPAGSRVLLTDSEGEQAANLIMSADAKISELTAASNGSSLVFSAEHAEGSIHIHSLELAEVVVAVEVDDDVERSLGVIDEVSIKTVFETRSAVNNVVFDVSGEQIAFAVGSCSTGSTIDVVDLVAGGYPLPIDPLLSARPVGFVSATELAILDYDPSCSGGGDLYVTDIVTGATELIRAGVDGAAVRRTEPPTRFNLVGVELTSPVDPQPAP